MTKLHELATRVEAYDPMTCPDNRAFERDLDHGIRALVVGDAHYCGDEDGAWACGNCWPSHGCGVAMGICDERTSYPADWRDDERLPRYTRSIDAARQLVPPQWGWSVQHLDSRAAQAAILHGGEQFAREAVTPALALTAACLRAHAAFSRCPYCDDTGDVHRADGEWLGKCTCDSGSRAKP